MIHRLERREERFRPSIVAQDKQSNRKPTFEDG